MKLDTSGWRIFRLNKLFELKGGYYNKKPEHSIKGEIPFLGSTENNNGVTEYYSIQDIEKWDKVGNEDRTLKNKLYDGNCIAVTVDGSVCNAYYQKDQFTCSHSVTALYLKNKDMSKQIALFLCAVIMREKYRWSYGRKPHDVKKLGNMTIKLPATPDGTPDWDFMESYMKTLHYKPLTTKNKPGNAPELETERWGKFKVGELFECDTTSAVLPEEMTDGEIPYITRSSENNGNAGRLGNSDKVVAGNCITIGAEGALAFYQPSDFIPGVKVYTLRNCFVNKYTGMFLVSILNKEFYKYSYGRARILSKIREETIKLPVTPDRTPDWQFMEDYIKALPYGDRL